MFVFVFFSFCTLSFLLPCNLYEALRPRAVTPQGRVFFVSFWSCVCVCVISFERSFFCMLILQFISGMWSGLSSIFQIHRWLIPTSLQPSYFNENLICGKKNKIFFFKHCIFFTSKNEFWFETVSSGSFQITIIITLFVRKPNILMQY